MLSVVFEPHWQSDRELLRHRLWSIEPCSNNDAPVGVDLTKQRVVAEGRELRDQHSVMEVFEEERVVFHFGEHNSQYFVRHALGDATAVPSVKRTPFMQSLVRRHSILIEGVLLLIERSVGAAEQSR